MVRSSVSESPLIRSALDSAMAMVRDGPITPSSSAFTGIDPPGPYALPFGKLLPPPQDPIIVKGVAWDTPSLQGTQLSGLSATDLTRLGLIASRCLHLLLFPLCECCSSPHHGLCP